jgi:hypothetical protein
MMALSAQPKVPKENTRKDITFGFALYGIDRVAAGVQTSLLRERTSSFA